MRSDKKVPAKHQSDVIRFEHIQIDTPAMILKVGEKTVPTTTTEFRLLDYFVRHAGIVLTRQQLIDAAWSKDPVAKSRSVDVYVRRLRVKIEPDPDNPSHLVTVHGAGYRFGVRK